MGNGFRLKRFLLVFLLSATLVTLSIVHSFAGEGDRIAWSTILPDESNISLQQQRVINLLEITLIELDSVIDENIRNAKISNDTDFTLNKDVSLVYDYLMYRIYELMKMDRKIKEDFAAQEKSFEKGIVSSDVIRQYFAMKEDYEKKGGIFFSYLDSFKRAVFVRDLRTEIKKLKSSIGELRSVMNLYSSYHIAIAAR